MTIRTKRIYGQAIKADGYRILVDRLWPRGVTKEKACVDMWMKNVAPSTVLRKWFNHEPEKWSLFLTKYRAELKESAAFEALVTLTGEHKIITLLYASKDEKYNQAEALVQFLNEG